LAAYTQDDGFHEIQLNGKQLVFLFMAATVVSVVIFLCGVLVGRGVRAERGDLTSAATETAVEVAPSLPADAARTPAATTGGPAPAPPAPVDELSYFNRLEKPTAPAEKLSKAETTPKPAQATAPAPMSSVPAAASASAAPAPAPTPRREPRAETSAAAEPPSSAYAVQVAALNVRSEADAMARRLTAKGYTAYVVAPPSGTPAVFRVRVGSYKTRREAEAMAARLQKEEQIKPWVTR
jgi:cell division septation protein DedD